MYGTILVPTDGSDGARAALDEAIELASRFGATVHSLYVVDVTATYPDDGLVDVTDALEGIGERTTDEAVDLATEAGVDAVGAVELGTPYRAIRDYVDDHDVDLVVMGTHGRTGLDRFLLGSVTEKVVRTAAVPVLTVRAPRDESDATAAADAATDDAATDDAATDDATEREED